MSLPTFSFSKIIIFTYATIALASCKNASYNIPFPYNETEFVQPISKPFKLSQPEKLKWDTINFNKYKSISQAKIDFDKLPSKPFDTTGFKPFSQPMSQTRISWDHLHERSFSFKKLPKVKFKFKVSILGKPDIIKRQIPQRIEDAKPNNFVIYDLPGWTVRTMLHASMGIFWVATDQGLCRIDGENISIYSDKQGIESTSINKMCEDKQGQIWIGTLDMGIQVLDIKAGTIKYITKTEGISNDSIWGLLCDKHGQVWIGGWGGGVDIVNEQVGIITHLNDSNGLSDDYVRSFLEESNGDIWIGAGDGIDIVEIRTGKIKHLDKTNGLSDNDIECLIEKNENEIWIGTRNGVNILDKKLEEIKHLGTQQCLKSNYIKEFLKDRYKQIWISEYNGGVDIIDGQENQYKHLRIRHLVDFDFNITKFINGPKDVIWIGTFTKGIVTCDETESIKYLGTDLLKDFRLNYFGGMLEDKHGRIWLGTDSGALLINLKSNNIRFIKLGLPIFRFLEDSFGKIWMSSPDNGLLVLDPTSGCLMNIGKEQGLNHRTIANIVEDSYHRIWTGDLSGEIKCIDLQLNSILILNPGNNSKKRIISDLFKDNEGQIWISTTDNGIVVINDKLGISRHSSDTHDPAATNVISSFTQDKFNRIWISRRTKGLSMIDLKDSSITDLSSKEGLAENAVLSIKSLDEETYALTPYGLTSIKPSVTDVKGTYNWNIRTYGSTKGFPNYQTSLISSVTTNNDELWWQMHDHITIQKPRQNDTISPVSQLTRIDIYNRPQFFLDIKRLNMDFGMTDTSLTDQKVSFKPKKIFSDYLDSLNHNIINWDSVTGPYNIPENMKLPNNMNFITFHFISTEAGNFTKTVYRYYLEGIDQKWSNISEETTSQNYTNLEPGKYTFKVASRGFNGIWGRPAEFKFTVLPPFWLTWWAYLFYIILSTSITYLFFSNHIKRLKKRQADQVKAALQAQEEERKRLSRDLHDDIGTKLSALNLFLSSLKGKALDTNHEEIKSLAQSSEQFIKEVVFDLRQLLMNLSPSVLEDFGYTSAVEGLVNKINETKLIHFELNVFGFKDRLQKDYELALYRITQELINNILKHANAKNISLQTGQRDDKIVLIIEDDGKGFDVNLKNDGYGLKNLETRTKLLNGKMTIDSIPGKGTTTLIEIPYNLT